MLFEEIMMDTASWNRYRVFRLLVVLPPDIYTINQLVKHFDFSYQQLYTLLHEVDNDLTAQSAFHEHFFIKNGGLDTRRLAVTVDDYRYLLVKEGIPYQFLCYLMRDDPQKSVENFCREVEISRSTLGRKLKPLSQYFKQYQLRISYSKLRIVGDETKIRMTLFYLFWFCVKGTYWPFSEEIANFSKFLVQKLQDRFTLSTTYVGRKELELFFGISLLRIRQQHFAPYKEKYDRFLSDSADFPMDLAALHLPGLPENVIKGESAYLHFLSLFAPIFYRIDDPNLARSLRTFQHQKNPIASLFFAVLEEAKQSNQIRCPQSLYDCLVGNLMHITFTAYIFEANTPNMFSLVDKDVAENALSYEIDSWLNAFFEKQLKKREYQILVPARKALTMGYKNLLLPFFEGRAKKKLLKVGLAVEQNLLLFAKLMIFLKDLSFVELCPFGNQLTDWDIIISSSQYFQQAHPEIPFYYWDFDASDEELVQLYSDLKQLYLKKNQKIFFLENS
ncbi:helix-turn-helix domain-containing protein [Enterococcus hirae]|nr:helix-turn-helix domain-containing protein [Enterococcus hirae]